jgi:hypothetical protein
LRIEFFAAPRIFEVGRNEAFDLLPETETGKDPANSCAGLKSMWHKGSSGILSIHPEQSTGYFPITWSWLLRVMVMAIVFLVMIYFIAVRGWNVGKDTASSILIAIGAVVCLVAIGGVLFAVVHRQQAGGEPFELLEGISVWPTVYLRLVAFMLAAGLIVTVCRRSRRLEEQLQGYFISAEPRDQEPAPDALTAGHSSDRSPEGLWGDYCRLKTLRARVKRVLGLAVPYAILCGMIIFAFGPPFVPFRGATSGKAHAVSLILAIGAFIMLLFWVVDATSMGVWLIKQIHKGYGGWSEEMKTLAAAAHRHPSRAWFFNVLRHTAAAEGGAIPKGGTDQNVGEASAFGRRGGWLEGLVQKDRHDDRSHQIHPQGCVCTFLGAAVGTGNLYFPHQRRWTDGAAIPSVVSVATCFCRRDRASP